MTTERPNTLAGLVEKRAEIAGQISHTRATLRQLIIDLDHVDAAIRIFDPSYDVEGIRQKLPTAAHRAVRQFPQTASGKIQKFILRAGLI